MLRFIGSLALLLSTSILLGAEPRLPSEKELLKQGEKVFRTTCFACHGADGKGLVPGTPDLTGKNSPLKQDATLLKERIWDGYQSEGSSLAMPPKGGNPQLKEPEVEAVIVYMRKMFLPK